MTYVDLDMLALQVRSKNSQRLYCDALSCHRAGAHGAVIVILWTAIVHDYLDKLAELALIGNAEAANALQRFERAGSIKETLELEGQVISDAQEKFELLSKLEALDLERLREDRHRCAHPSMHEMHAPYRPTAELARMHLLNAAVHLLIRPPVQGKGALDYVWKSIRSEVFPTTTAAARESLQHGPMGRAKESLVKDVVKGLSTDLLKQERPPNERSRQLAALAAIAEMYVECARVALDEKLNKVVDAAEDVWPRLLDILVWVEIAWLALREDQRKSVERYVAQRTPDAHGTVAIVEKAYRVLALRSAAIVKVREMSASTLSRLIGYKERDEYLVVAIARLRETGLYTDMAQLRACLVPRVRAMSSVAYRSLIEALGSSQKLRRYDGWVTFVQSVLDGAPGRRVEAPAEWEAVKAIVEEKGISIEWEATAEASVQAE